MHFAVDRLYWSRLCLRIEELTSGQSTLVELGLTPDVEAEALRIAACFREYTAFEPGLSDDDPCYERVEESSVRDSDGRSIGTEQAVLEALKALRFPELLNDLGFNRPQHACALANIIGCMVFPASERKTAFWLRNNSAACELLGVNPNRINDMALHRATDKLRRHQNEIESLLFDTARDLLNFTPSVTLYDLTNTYLESSGYAMPKARRGRSQEKRSDAPLLTLGLVLDASGFVRRSRVLAGNVSECRTLERSRKSLQVSREAVVIMDRGIATEENLAWLRARDYRYLVDSRSPYRVHEEDQVEARVVTASGGSVQVYTERVTQQAQDGSEFEECLLRCHSEDRQGKEQAIIDRFQKRFETALTELHEGLSKKGKGTRKKLVDVQRRVERLEKQHSRVSSHYGITVTPDDQGEKAVSVTWTRQVKVGSMMAQPRGYCLRSNVLEWDAETMCRTSGQLNDIEAVFRSLKSELGLRPVCHQRQAHANAHMLISVIDYQAIQLLRQRMKRAGQHDSWTTVRDVLGPLQRTTTTFRRDDGRMVHLRKTADPDAFPSALYQAMQVVPPPRHIQKSVI